MQVFKTMPGFVLITQIALEKLLHPKCAMALQALIDLSGTETKQTLSNLLKRAWRAGCQNHMYMVGHDHKTQQPNLSLFHKPKESRGDFFGDPCMGQIHPNIRPSPFRDEINMV